jgi:hypothetical protein
MANAFVTAYQNITEFCILFRNSTDSSIPNRNHVYLSEMCSTNFDVNNAQMTNPQARYAQE